MRKHPTRRQFVSQSSVVAAGLPWLHRPNRALPAVERPRMHVERAGIAAIGMRYQGSVITEKAKLYGDIVAIADVDRHVREQARPVLEAALAFTKITVTCWTTRPSMSS